MIRAATPVGPARIRGIGVATGWHQVARAPVGSHRRPFWVNLVDPRGCGVAGVFSRNDLSAGHLGAGEDSERGYADDFIQVTSMRERAV